MSKERQVPKFRASVRVRAGKHHERVHLTLTKSPLFLPSFGGRGDKKSPSLEGLFSFHTVNAKITLRAC